MRRLAALFLAIVAFSIPASAQQDAVPPIELYKTMAEANKASGWVAFREYDGRQWVYFTPLVTLHCLSRCRRTLGRRLLR